MENDGIIERTQILFEISIYYSNFWNNKARYKNTIQNEQYNIKTRQYYPKSNTFPALKRDTKYDAIIQGEMTWLWSRRAYRK